MTRSSYWYQVICPCDLDHLWTWPLSGAFVFHKHILFMLYSSHFEIFCARSCESKMTSKIIRFILWYCYSKIILHWIYRFPFIKESWNDKCIFAKTVEQQANLLLHLCVQTRADCYCDRCLLCNNVFLEYNLQPIVTISLFWPIFTKNRSRFLC